LIWGLHAGTHHFGARRIQTHRLVKLSLTVLRKQTLYLITYGVKDLCSLRFWWLHQTGPNHTY